MAIFTRAVRITLTISELSFREQSVSLYKLLDFTSIPLESNEEQRD